MRVAKKKINIDDTDLLSIDQYSLASDQQSAQERQYISEDIVSKPELSEDRSRQLNAGAQDHLNRLILQDLAVQPTLRPAQKTQKKKRIHQAAESIPESLKPVQHAKLPKQRHSRLSAAEKPSQYVLDLRKHFLIEKYNLDTFEQPRKRLGAKLQGFVSALKPRERIEWHYPDQRKTKASIATQVVAAPPELPQPQMSSPEQPSNTVQSDEYSEPEAIVQPVEPEDTVERVPWRMRVYAVGTFWAVLFFVLMPIPIITYASRISADGHSVMLKSLLAFSSLKAGVADITNSDFTQAQGTLTQAQKDFNDITATLNSYSATLNAIALVPGVGSKVHLAKAVSAIGFCPFLR